MEVAVDSLVAMLPNLKDDDKCAIVLFDDKAEVLHPLTQWSKTNKESLVTKIKKLRARGGTRLALGTC
jgi:secreted protein with Ig-like and vWFA domain